MGKVVSAEGAHRQELQRSIEVSVGPVRVASPYVTDTKLLTVDTRRDIKLLTTLSTLDVVSGATSLDSMEFLVRAGVECRCLSEKSKLHAKVYIFGDQSAVVTSANLTTSAFESNIEVGVRVGSNEVSELVRWFETLWDRAEPVDRDRISDLRLRTDAIRKEYSALRARCELLEREGTRPDTAIPALASRLGFSPSYFLCNTDRAHGFVREKLMMANRYAAAWEDFDHTAHMEKLRRGDIVFMYANRAGVIGVGRALGACERLEAGSSGRLVDEYEEPGQEWRVPVEWLRWVDEQHASSWRRPPPTTFTDVSSDVWTDLRDAVINELLGGPELARDLGLFVRQYGLPGSAGP